MRRFVLQRDVDHSGVSGTGIIADGVQFVDGKVVTRWRSTIAVQTCFWDKIEDVEAIHGHHGSTRVIWIDKHHSTQKAIPIGEKA